MQKPTCVLCPCTDATHSTGSIWHKIHRAHPSIGCDANTTYATIKPIYSPYEIRREKLYKIHLFILYIIMRQDFGWANMHINSISKSQAMFNGHMYGWVCVRHTCVECIIVIVAIDAATHRHHHRYQCHHWKATRQSVSDRKTRHGFQDEERKRWEKMLVCTMTQNVLQLMKGQSCIHTHTHMRVRLSEAVNASRPRISSFNGIRCIFTTNIRPTAKYLCENLWASSLEKQFNIKLCNLAAHILPFRPIHPAIGLAWTQYSFPFWLSHFRFLFIVQPLRSSSRVTQDNLSKGGHFK